MWLHSLTFSQVFEQILDLAFSICLLILIVHLIYNLVIFRVVLIVFMLKLNIRGIPNVYTTNHLTLRHVQRLINSVKFVSLNSILACWIMDNNWWLLFFRILLSWKRWILLSNVEFRLLYLLKVLIVIEINVNLNFLYSLWVASLWTYSIRHSDTLTTTSSATFFWFCHKRLLLRLISLSNMTLNYLLLNRVCLICWDILRVIDNIGINDVIICSSWQPRSLFLEVSHFSSLNFIQKWSSLLLI